MGQPTDDLGVQSDYLLSVLDEVGNPPSQVEFGGVSPAFAFRMPPQSLQIQRSIRAEVLKDLNRGTSVVTGGEGLGRISIHGTHGVGVFVDSSTPSEGKQARDAVARFFGAFVDANDERGRTGKAGLRMVFWMVGGGWSNPQDEAYLVWPDSFPTDQRTHSRPHAWDWSLSLILLAPFRLDPAFDPSTVMNPDEIVSWASRLDSALAGAVRLWKGAKSVLQAVRDLRSNLSLIKNRIVDFIAGVKEAIYEVTDLVRGSAQICSTILKAISPRDFADDVKTALRGTAYECRQFLGQCSITASQFRRSGALHSSLTSPRSMSPSRPVSVGLSPGDSLQAIAARLLGDSSRWTDLVAVNGLVWPFVDFSGPRGRPGSAYAGQAVLGAADTLKLPLPASQGPVGIADDPIGTDLPDAPPAAGILQGGVDNLVAALLRRLITPRGRVPWHPAYGSALPSMVGGASDAALVMAARAEVSNCLSADPRVLGVQNVKASFAGQVVDVSAEVVTPFGTVLIQGSVS